jgi:hypothetical protein
VYEKIYRRWKTYGDTLMTELKPEGETGFKNIFKNMSI